VSRPIGLPPVRLVGLSAGWQARSSQFAIRSLPVIARQLELGAVACEWPKAAEIGSKLSAAFTSAHLFGAVVLWLRARVQVQVSIGLFALSVCCFELVDRRPQRRAAGLALHIGQCTVHSAQCSHRHSSAMRAVCFGPRTASQT